MENVDNITVVNYSYTMAKKAWWLYVLRGILSIIFGIILVSWPGIGLVAFISLFAATLAVDGIASLVVGAFTKSPLAMLMGAFNLTLLTILLLVPRETGLVFVYLVSFWAILAGVTLIGSVFWGARGVLAKVFNVILGLAYIGFGVYLFTNPLEGILSVIWVVGLFSIIGGVFTAASPLIDKLVGEEE